VRLHEWMKYRDGQALRAEPSEDREVETPGGDGSEAGTQEDASREAVAAPPTSEEGPDVPEAQTEGGPEADVSAEKGAAVAQQPTEAADVGEPGVKDRADAPEATSSASVGQAASSPLAGVREEVMRRVRTVRAQKAQQALPLDVDAVPPRARRGSVRETREQLISRLMDPLLTLRETATLLGVCPTTVRRYTNRGMLNHFRTAGNQRRFRLSDVLEFMEEQAQAANDKKGE